MSIGAPIERATELAIDSIMGDDANYQEAKRIQMEGGKKYTEAAKTKLENAKFEESQLQFDAKLQYQYDALAQNAAIARARLAKSGKSTTAKPTAEFLKKIRDS